LAALQLAIEHGLENVLVEDIAASVGVSPRTFNNYFSSKYEAICALGLDRAERIGVALRERPAAEPLWDAITHAVLGQYVADAPIDKRWIDGMRLVTTTPALRGEYLKTSFAVQRALAEAIAMRLGVDLEKDMRPSVIAAAVAAASEVAVERWLHTDARTPLGRTVRLALRQLAEGVSATAIKKH
jgi:AcrR family transcriptional regulator